MSALGPLKKLAFLPLLFVLFSCVKDVDLDQYDEIVIPPAAALDLVYFTLDETNFFSPSGTLMTPSDDLRLEFLDDDYIQTGLVEAEFQFQIIHSFQESFTVWISFFAENGSLQHKFAIEVPPAAAGEQRLVNFTEEFYEEDIGVIRRSIRMLVEVEMHPTLGAGAAATGELQLKSKGLYKFEF